MVTLSNQQRRKHRCPSQLIRFFTLVPLAFLPFLWFRLASFNTKDILADNTLPYSPIHENYNRSVAIENSAEVNADTVAHVVSLITCQKESRVKGFLDALIILRHSIHRNSVHAHPASRYSYQMVAVIHESGGCTSHIPLLKRLGYITLVKGNPVDVSKITTNDWYRDHVGGENCCGDAEFVKLYAYQLTAYPVVVHWDLDVAVLKPLDDLYDAMLHDKDSFIGKTARKRLAIQNPEVQKLPDVIDAFVTRDVTSAKPWEQVRAVQGGFVVARPNLRHFEMYQEFILDANYTPGRGPGSGWGGLGYGGFQGAMAYQGVLAYFYDQVYPGHAVELDVCRWNQVVADVIYRGPERKQNVGQCRQYPADGIFETNTPENGKCEDCRVLPLEETYTVHYTACKKPWECTVPHPRVPGNRNKAHTYRLRELTNITTCGLLFAKYFSIRHEIELRIATTAKIPPVVPEGKFRSDYFRGYCKRKGSYIPLAFPNEPFSMKEVYGF